jgi:hypothetical protein
MHSGAAHHCVQENRGAHSGVVTRCYKRRSTPPPSRFSLGLDAIEFAEDWAP